MNSLRGFSRLQEARGLHGCNSVGAWMRLRSSWFIPLLALAMSLGGLQSANADLLLYISDGTTSITIRDGDTLYDTNSATDAISVDIGQLDGLFADWDFGAFFNVYSNLLDVDNRPNQVLNLEFEATNTSGSAKSLEVLATFVGDNGRSESTTVSMYGGARTSQLSGLDYTFVASYSQNASDEFYTNGYNDQSGPPRYVLTAAPQLNDDPNSDNLILDFTSVNPMDIVGDATYALTYGVRITNLESGKLFGTASEVDYVLPEPASIATWAVAVGLLGLVGKRKRKALAE